ncbi:MAG: hypothetical protein OER95_07800, partial [Acidimicrobiia bacterium]|nr:hypothetical protein [Acidimicrobiia bacterium]
MRKIMALAVVAALLVSLLAVTASAQTVGAPATAELAPEVAALLDSLAPGEMTTVIATLREQTDLSAIPGANRAARLRGVIRALQAKANASQKQILALLNARTAQGTVAEYTPFWILNALSVTA